MEYERSDLIVLVYHTQGGQSTPETRDLCGAYGLLPTWTPSVVLNGSAGATMIMGPQSYESYKERFDALGNRFSNISLTAQLSATAFMNTRVELTNLSTEPIYHGSLYAVVYEDTKQSEGHYLVKDITPMETVDLQGGQTKSFELKSTELFSSTKRTVIIFKALNGLIMQALFIK